MKIAQVSPLIESVPPQLYGGTERVVSYLTEALVELGHDVTLFASGDSKTSAKMVGIIPIALRLTNGEDAFTPHVLQLQHVIENAAEFDIIHFHTDYMHFPTSRLCNYTHVTTLHGRQDLPELLPLYKKFSDIPIISISYSQRIPIPFANWVGNVYHGLPEHLYEFNEYPDDYAVFLGRLSPEKGPEDAIEIARRTGLKLKIAAKVDKKDQDYFDNNIRQLLDQPHIDFVGEVGEEAKNHLLGKAKVLLFPIKWPEPFGLVMIESLACGTPVIAYNRGAIPEVISHGKTGFIVSDINEAVHAIKNIDVLSRKDCRTEFMKRFVNTRMAEDYLKVYELLIQEGQL